MEEKMTTLTNQAELNFLSETELHFALRQVFKKLVSAEQSSPQYVHAATALEEIKGAIRRREIGLKL
jgi:hypothetical protein